MSTEKPILSEVHHTSADAALDAIHDALESCSSCCLDNEAERITVSDTLIIELNNIVTDCARGRAVGLLLKRDDLPPMETLDAIKELYQ